LATFWPQHRPPSATDPEAGPAFKDAFVQISGRTSKA
jgi:hypothetical protein